MLNKELVASIDKALLSSTLLRIRKHCTYMLVTCNHLTTEHTEIIVTTEFTVIIVCTAVPTGAEALLTPT
jgi:hypothetical protein